MLKKLAFCTLCLIAQPALSETYVEGTVTQLSVGTTYARVQLDQMVSAEGCANYTWYLLPFPPGEGKEMYAAVLTAKTSGQRVKLQLTGCSSGYPSIAHVYLL